MDPQFGVPCWGGNVSCRPKLMTNRKMPWHLSTSFFCFTFRRAVKAKYYTKAYIQTSNNTISLVNFQKKNFTLPAFTKRSFWSIEKMLRPLLSTSLPTTFPQSKKTTLLLGDISAAEVHNRLVPLQPDGPNHFPPLGSESVQVDDRRNKGQLRDLSPSGCWRKQRHLFRWGLFERNVGRFAHEKCYSRCEVCI